MYPFYHPTTVLIVDDDPVLVKSLETLLQSNDVLCKSFTNPLEAVDYTLAQEKKRPSSEEFFSAYSEILNISELERGDLLIKLETSYLSNLLQNSERFGQISVAIIDYDMPEMTGDDVCRKLKDLPIKKIMLTGQATQMQAVTAFNEKIIDCFLGKRELDLEEKLQEEINKLQREFFSHNTETLKLAFSLQETEFVKDPVFAKVFHKTKDTNNIVEYYLNTHPPGIFMFQPDGTPLFLLVYDIQRLRAHYEIAQESDAPKELLDQISSCKYIPLFPTKSGYYERYMSKSWQDYLWPARKVDGQKEWYVSNVINDEFLRYGLENFASFEKYKRER